MTSSPWTRPANFEPPEGTKQDRKRRAKHDKYLGPRRDHKDLVKQCTVLLRRFWQLSGILGNMVQEAGGQRVR